MNKYSFYCELTLSDSEDIYIITRKCVAKHGVVIPESKTDMVVELYVNMNGKSFSFWKDSLGKYVDFILSKNTNVIKNNKKSDKDANESTNKELNDSLTFSFDNNILTIYDSNGTIHEIPIPDVKPLEDKIKELEGRIRKLEDALL